MTSNADPRMKPFTDFLVDTNNPEFLDDTLQQMPMMNARVMGRGMPEGFARKDDHYVVRVTGDPGFFLFAMENQGYCKVIEETSDFKVGGNEHDQ